MSATSERVRPDLEVVNSLGIEILARTSDLKVRIRRQATGEEFVIDPSSLDYAKLLLICGPIAREKVQVHRMGTDNEQRNISHFVEAIAIVASSLPAES